MTWPRVWIARCFAFASASSARSTSFFADDARVVERVGLFELGLELIDGLHRDLRQALGFEESVVGLDDAVRDVPLRRLAADVAMSTPTSFTWYCSSSGTSGVIGCIAVAVKLHVSASCKVNAGGGPNWML